MKRNFIIKTLGTCTVGVCMALIFLFGVMLSKASDTSDESVNLVTIDAYSESDLETEINNQKANNYLYAGLYKAGTTESNLTKSNAVKSPVVGTAYVAKFVPEGVMGIQAQVSSSLLSNPESIKSSIRFVTAVDSLVYTEIGFSITRVNEAGETIELVDANSVTKYVYEKLYGVDVTSDDPGEPIKYTPQDIHALANYFKTYTIKNVPENYYNTDLIVVPYWKTYDGRTVTGTTGIKTVNLGRSWVYINTSKHTDGTEYGTYDHPFTDLAKALDAIVQDENGKIVIKAGSTIEQASLSWGQRGKDLTITGESGTTETLDLSAIQTVKVGDGVTFTNMTLKLYENGALYANGNRLKIDETVISDNPKTTIYGGGSGSSSSVSGTDVTILAGTYMAIYGGGRLGTVDGDTHVTIRNANVYSTEDKNTYRYVCGGGKNGNVTGSTYVTVGEGFNKDLEWNHPDHKTLSLVCGGGYAAESTNTAIVEGNTYVVIEDNNKTNNVDGAKASYVYGAGVGYSEVQGTSHVTCDGGYVMSIYGGGATNAANSSTSVVMQDGKVEQIFGGNANGMTGNTDVRILGGNILRRVYGGCYNEYNVLTGSWTTTNGVIGYTSVTFGPDTYASLATNYSGGDATYYAVSRLGSNYTSTEGDEIGVFVVNDYDVEGNPNKDMVGYTNFMKSFESKPYHYLVQSTTGGAVYSEGDSLRVIPDENMVATVRVDNAEENGGSVHAYITSEGLCELPELDATGKRNVYVVFTKETPVDVDLDKYEATANGTHYETLEEAISVANTLSTTTETDKAVVVTLLKNAEVEETLNIVKSANIVIENADGVTATVNRADGLTGKSLLNVAAGAKVTVNGIILDGRKSSEIAAGTTTLTSLTKGSASLVAVSGEAAFTDAIIQYTYTSKEGAGVYISNNGKVTMTGGAISNNYVSGNSGGAVSVYLGTFTMEDGTISNNTASASGGAFMVRNGSKLTINGGTISDNKALVSDTNGGGAIFQHQNTTIDINGGTISDNTSYFDGGAIYVYGGGSASTLTIKDAMISGNTAENSGDGGNGAAVYIGASSSLTLEGGATFQGNTATANGGAIAVVGTVTEKEGTSCTFTGNQAVNGGAIYVSGTFTMKGSNLDGNTASGDENGYGGGVYTAESGNFTMTGGNITANTAKTNGSGVYVGATGANAAFNMSGGTISGHGTEATPTTFRGNAVCVAENSTFIMSGTADISSNYSSAPGNGVYVHDGGSFTMNGGTIQNNHTTNTGSGVEAYGSFEMTAGTIKDNTADGSAGGVIIRNTGSFNMSGGTIENNTATVNGGGLYIQANDNDVNITGGTIVDNTATAGGGIYVSSNKTVTMSDVTIQDNTATGNGGGICVNKAAGCILKSGNILENDAVNGGGVYTENAGKFTLENGDITANSATTCGSGVYVGTTTAEKLFTMSGGTISGHGTTKTPSQAEGAGVYVASGAKFNLSGGTIDDNHTTGNGAGVSTYGEFNMSKTSTIQNNTTTSNGGGVYVGGGKYTLNNEAEQTIYGNRANNGGGVAIVSEFNFKKGVITNNTATTNGGGTYVDGGAFTMTDATSTARTISANTAKAGAGVYVNDGAFTMSEGTITQNATTSGDDKYGAGVYLNAGTFDLSGGSICNHGAGSATEVTTRGTWEGGGICAAGTSVVNMTGGSISNNYVNGSGAGVAIIGTAKFVMSGGTISDNTAGASGGAMIVRSTRKETIDDVETQVAAFAMNGGTISGNSALVNKNNGGGAIFQHRNTMVEIAGGTIQGNSAVANGGAILLFENSTLTMTDGTLTGNTATTNGGGVYVNAGTFDMQGGTLTGNTATANGGGVYVNAGTFDMQGGSIQNHGTATTTAGRGAVEGAGVYLNAGTFEMNGPGNPTIQSNYSSSYGAGVSVHGGTFMMNAGKIDNNTSGANGAGIYLATGIGLEVNGGAITNNRATGNGGALVADGNNLIKLTSGEISGNTATGAVQGVFLQQVTKGSQVIMNVGFNMGTNDIRFNNVSNTEPILKFVGGSTLTHYTTANKLQIGLHNSSKTGNALFDCGSAEAAANIIQLLNSNNTSTTNNNNKWGFSVDGLYIKAAK